MSAGPYHRTIVRQAAPDLRLARYRTEIEAAIQDCLTQGVYVGGPAVEKFEAELASFLRVRHAVSCNSCTDALALALSALGIRPGHEVILPSLTAAGTCVGITQAGATPRFADVSRTTRNLDVPSIERAMSPNVRAIVVVHLHGCPADLDPILEFANENSLLVIEDCAQAIGATYKGKPVGTFGAAGVFSFYPTKNLGCIGDGGAIVSNDASMAKLSRSMTNYGWNSERDVVRQGKNSRLDGIQAAVLSALLTHLQAGNAERVAAARKYDAVLKGSNIRGPQCGAGAVYHQYAIEADDRQALVGYLSDLGIETGCHYARGLHSDHFFKAFGYEGQDFSNTDALANRLVSLPIQPELMIEQPRILSALEEYISK